MHWKKLVASLTVFVVIGGGIYALATWKMNSIASQNAAAAAMPEHSETVVTQEAWQIAWQPSTSAVGTVTATRSVELKNEVMGVVSEVLFESGQVVEEGALLLKLDTSVEEAELSAARAMAKLAQVRLSRFKTAIAASAVSQIEVDEAQATFDQTTARVLELDTRMRKKEIRAPFRARAGLRNVHPGQYLAEGTHITTLQGTDSAIHVDFSLPQMHSIFLKPGLTVTIQPAHMPTMTATVVAVDSLINRATRNAMVRVQVANPEGVLRPGMYVDVRVPIKTPRSVTLVPATAVRRAPYGDHIYLIITDKEGKAHAKQRFVTIGPAIGANMVIEKGVQAGDTIATDGSFKLYDGVLVVPHKSQEVSAR